MGEHDIDGRHMFTREELHAMAVKRFGPNPSNWAFKCPMCSDIAVASDFPSPGSERLGQDCVGRHRGQPEAENGRPANKERGCNWCAYGLFRGPWIITLPADGDQPAREMGAFPLATVEETIEHARIHNRPWPVVVDEAQEISEEDFEGLPDTARESIDGTEVWKGTSHGG